jgi:hypothetical protein
MHKNWIFTIILFLSSSLFAAPAFNQPLAKESYRDTVASFYGIANPQNLIILPVVGYQQTEDCTCGPAAVMSLLHYYHRLSDKEMTKRTELKIAHEMGTKRLNGTSPEQIVIWLRAHGFKAASGTRGSIKMLKENLERGQPTLVKWADWGGHWSVVAGYDTKAKSYLDDKDTMFFADPAAQYDNVKTMNGLIRFNPDRFASMWVDYQYSHPRHLVRGIYIIAVPK